MAGLAKEVSMPPRRSCFRLGTLLLGGVVLRFNATTAFLLRPRHGSGSRATIVFQCHHGVPASHLWELAGEEPPRFNATTAFLLRFWSGPDAPWLFRFNATTAFLLQGRWFQ